MSAKYQQAIVLLAGKRPVFAASGNFFPLDCVDGPLTICGLAAVGTRATDLMLLRQYLVAAVISRGKRQFAFVLH